MQKYTNTVLSTISGLPVANATVSVTSATTGLPATLYSDNGTTTVGNSVTTDANGMFSFYAADGRYNLLITGRGIAAIPINDVLLEDPATPLAQDLVWGSQGYKVKADFSDADLTKRITFQTTVANGATVIPHVPAGTGVKASNLFLNNSTPTNSGSTEVGIDAAGSFIDSNKQGTGTVLDFAIRIAGAAALAIAAATSNVSTAKQLTVGTGSVNNFTIAPAAAGLNPTITAQSSTDTNVQQQFTSQGPAGGFLFTGDNTGGTILAGQSVAGAVNYTNFTSAIASGNPTLAAAGTDTNINMQVSGKATGYVQLGNTLQAGVLQAQGVASGVNGLKVQGAITANAPNILAQGADSNIDIKLTPKGTGAVQFMNTVANGTVACVFTASVGPTGSQTAIRGWLPIKTSAGVTGYVPFW